MICMEKWDTIPFRPSILLYNTIQNTMVLIFDIVAVLPKKRSCDLSRQNNNLHPM